MSKLNTKNWIKLSPVQYLCKRDRQPRNNCTRPNCRCCLFPVLSRCCSAVSLQTLGDRAMWSHVATASAGQAFPGQTTDFSFQRWQQCCLLQVWAVPPCKELMGPRSPCFLLLLLLSYLGFVAAPTSSGTGQAMQCSLPAGGFKSTCNFFETVLMSHARQ